MCSSPTVEVTRRPVEVDRPPEGRRRRSEGAGEERERSPAFNSVGAVNTAEEEEEGGTEDAGEVRGEMEGEVEGREEATLRLAPMAKEDDATEGETSLIVGYEVGRRENAGGGAKTPPRQEGVVRVRATDERTGPYQRIEQRKR